MTAREMQTTDQRVTGLVGQIRRQHKRIRALFRNDDDEALRFIAGAMTVIERNPDLLNATPASVLGCFLEAASLGLQPGALSHVHFVRYKSTCTLIADYRGLIALARSGDPDLVDVVTRCVYRDDPFRLILGDEEKIEHSPGPHYGDDSVDPDVGYPEAIVGAYAIAIYQDGRKRHEFMTAPQIEAVRSRSMAARKGPWVSDWPEQARKTVSRRLTKTLPKAPIANRLSVLDEMAEMGVDQGLAVQASTAEQDAQQIVDAAAPKPPEAEEKPQPAQAAQGPARKAETRRKAAPKRDEDIAF